MAEKTTGKRIHPEISLDKKEVKRHKSRLTEFDKRKKLVLAELEANEKEHKRDKSRQGFVDEEIADLVRAINFTKNNYTTSSCAGRILVLFRPYTKNKSDVTWIFKSHKESSFEEITCAIKEFLKKNNEKGIMAFKQEPMIIHLETRDLESAHSLMQISGSAGFKKKSIIGIKRRIVVEITSSQIIECPIGEDSELKCADDHLKWMIDLANNNIRYNKKMIDALEKEIKKSETESSSEKSS